MPITARVIRSFEPIIEPYDLALKPMPPIAIPAEPITLVLINSRLFVILI